MNIHTTKPLRTLFREHAEFADALLLARYAATGEREQHSLAFRHDQTNYHLDYDRRVSFRLQQHEGAFELAINTAQGQPLAKVSLTRQGDTPTYQFSLAVHNQNQYDRLVTELSKEGRLNVKYRAIQKNRLPVAA